MSRSAPSTESVKASATWSSDPSTQFKASPNGSTTSVPALITPGDSTNGAVKSEGTAACCVTVTV